MTLIIVFEWCDANQKLVKHDSHCPPVDVFVIARGFINHFWSYIVICTEEHLSLLLFGFFKGFGYSEVDDFDIAVLVKHNVIQFQVSVDVSIGMKMTDS